MLFRKKLTDEEKNNLIMEEKEKLRNKLQETYLKYTKSSELENLLKDIKSVSNCISVELEHPSFVKVYYTNGGNTEHKMLDYKNYGMSPLSTVEHPIQCLSFIRLVSEKINKEDFEFFLNDEDKYNSCIYNSNFDSFIDVYLEKTFNNCVIQSKPQVYCSYQLYSFDILSFRKKGMYQTKSW